MNSHQQLQLENMRVFHKHLVPSPFEPRIVTLDQGWELSQDLIVEELEELATAKTLIDRADALADLEYVLYQAANNSGMVLNQGEALISFPSFQIPLIPTLVDDEQWQQDFLEVIDAGVENLFEHANLISDRHETMNSLLKMVIGAGLYSGFKMHPIFEEVHRVNMSKLWTKQEMLSFQQCHTPGTMTFEEIFDGPYAHKIIARNPDNGKYQKPPNYIPPNLQPIIDAQLNGN